VRSASDGAVVVCVDNFFTGARRNVEHLLDHKHFEVIRHDVTFPLYVEVDEIYNLACPASPIHYQHPVQTTRRRAGARTDASPGTRRRHTILAGQLWLHGPATRTSVHGAINMLGLAKRLRCRILQASTSEVYGDPDVHLQREDYWGRVNPVGPRSCYVWRETTGQPLKMRPRPPSEAQTRSPGYGEQDEWKRDSSRQDANCILSASMISGEDNSMTGSKVQADIGEGTFRGAQDT
jgi:hypothetical protein